MRTLLAIVTTCVTIALPSTSAFAASEKFALEYRVERADAGKLDLATCLTTVQGAARRLGFIQTAVNTYPGQLAVWAGGPRGGGGSLTAYCIAVDRKTAYVVQAIDYNHATSPAARRAADAIHAALLNAGRR